MHFFQKINHNTKYSQSFQLIKKKITHVDEIKVVTFCFHFSHEHQLIKNKHFFSILRFHTNEDAS